MHHTTSASSFSRASSEHLTRVAPPGPIARWTGRAVLTIPLPSLASLRLARATGAYGASDAASFDAVDRVAVALRG